MDRTVGEHIRTLEKRRKLLAEQITNEKNRARRNQFETELRAIDSALTLFYAALEIESRISQNP